MPLLWCKQGFTWCVNKEIPRSERALQKFGLHDGKMMTHNYSTDKGCMSALCVEKWVKHSTREDEMECHHMLSICTHVKKKKDSVSMLSKAM